MAKWSMRERLVIVVAAPIGSALVALWVGPAYLKPLPTWLQVVIALACLCFIATVAIYSRRRARRASRPHDLV